MPTFASILATLINSYGSPSTLTVGRNRYRPRRNARAWPAEVDTQDTCSGARRVWTSIGHVMFRGVWNGWMI